MAYKSMQGKEVDMEKLMLQNELMPAVGNIRVNARGDELGPGGAIIRKREDIINAYYEDNPAAAPMRSKASDPATTNSAVAEGVTTVQSTQRSKKTQSTEEE